MVLREERLTTRPSDQAWRPAPVVFAYYECDNDPCSYVERAS
jgi:hypothetical protein